MAKVIRVEHAKQKLSKMKQMSSLKDTIGFLLLIISLVCLISWIVVMSCGMQIYHAKGADGAKTGFGMKEFVFEDTWLSVPCTLIWFAAFLMLLIALCQDQNQYVYMHLFTWVTTAIFLYVLLVIIIMYLRDHEPIIRQMFSYFDMKHDWYRRYTGVRTDMCKVRQYYRCCAYRGKLSDNFCFGSNCKVPDCCCDNPPCSFTNYYLKTCDHVLLHVYPENIRFFRIYYTFHLLILFINTLLAIFHCLIMHFRQED